MSSHARQVKTKKSKFVAPVPVGNGGGRNGKRHGSEMPARNIERPMVRNNTEGLTQSSITQGMDATQRASPLVWVQGAADASAAAGTDGTELSSAALVGRRVRIVGRAAPEKCGTILSAVKPRPGASTRHEVMFDDGRVETLLLDRKSKGGAGGVPADTPGVTISSSGSRKYAFVLLEEGVSGAGGGGPGDSANTGLDDATARQMRAYSSGAAKIVKGVRKASAAKASTAAAGRAARGKSGDRSSPRSTRTASGGDLPAADGGAAADGSAGDAATGGRKGTLNDTMQPIGEWLSAHRLGMYEASFLDLGCELVGDLVHVDMGALDGMMLKPVHKKRLAAAMGRARSDTVEAMEAVGFHDAGHSASHPDMLAIKEVVPPPAEQRDDLASGRGKGGGGGQQHQHQQQSLKHQRLQEEDDDVDMGSARPHREVTESGSLVQSDQPPLVAGKHKRRVLVALLVLPLFAAACVLFTELVVFGTTVGKGAQLHGWVTQHYGFAKMCIGSAVLLALALYLLDCSYWDERYHRWLRTLQLTVVALGSIGAFFTTDQYPAASFGVFIALCVLYVSRVKKLVYPGSGGSNVIVFFKDLGTVLIWEGLLLVELWGYWIAKDKLFWNAGTKQEFRRRIKCAPRPAPCAEANLLWVAPLLFGAGGVVFGMISRFLGKSVAKGRSKLVRVRTAISIIIALAFLMWVSASIAAAGVGLSSTILQLSLFAGGALALMIATAIGWDSLKHRLATIPLMVSLGQSVRSDWMKALFVFCCWLPFAAYLALSAANHWVRVHLTRHPAVELHRQSIDREKEAHMRVTLVAHNQLALLGRWRWSSVLVKVMWWGVILFVLNVGVMKVVTLFLAYLNGVLEALPLGAVTCIFYGIGLTMFLLPPVPGVPVYLAGGVILTAKAQDSLGFANAIGFTVVVCFMIKLNAIAMQQKLIGERMGSSVKVRAMIGVNSTTVRAIKMILMKPGLSPDKVFILCGGPDWPTSVTTGILRLSLVSMLCGSLPVVLLITPCVCAGGFLLRRNDKSGPWAAISDISIAVASIFQFGAMLAAMYYIEKVAHEKREELSQQALDKEVAQIDQKQVKRAEMYERLTDWHDPKFPESKKQQLKLGTVLIVMSVYLCLGMDSLCFRKFSVTSKIGAPFDPEDPAFDADDPGLGGSGLNLVKPMGWGAILFFTLGCGLLWSFRKWARRKVATHARTTFQGAVNKVIHAEQAIAIMQGGPGGRKRHESVESDNRAVAPGHAVQNPVTMDASVAKGAEDAKAAPPIDHWI